MPEPYSYGIKIVKDGDKLAVFVKERRANLTPAQAALLACLHENSGHVISYERLGQALGFKSTRKQERNIIKQHMVGIRKTLAAHKAPCLIAIVPDIGYALCRWLERYGRKFKIGQMVYFRPNHTLHYHLCPLRHYQHRHASVR